MGKSLIITEKPSVAREFAAVLHVSGKRDGYIENEDYVITWCVGHLVGLVYPEEYDEKYRRWKLEDLPFLPKDYKYDVIKEVSRQYGVVHGMLMRRDIDRVYWAGDAGKEGQTIEENIRNFGGVRPGMEELRVWIDSQTQEEILRGIREARPMSDYARLGDSGIMRTIEDYAMGINFSRVMSVKYGRLLNDAAGLKKYSAIAVGRVMTCVLGMVVIREREIRNFKETPFYRVVGSFGGEPGGEKGLKQNLIRENGVMEESARENGVRENLIRENGVMEESARENGVRENLIRENGNGEESARENGVRENLIRENGVMEESARENRVRENLIRENGNGEESVRESRVRESLNRENRIGENPGGEVWIEAEWRAVEGSRYFESPVLYKENGFKEEAKAQEFIASLQGKTAQVASIERSTARKSAPLLFNLAELQGECSRKFKISPDETLQAVQTLYEKKLTTYPRTDARVLSSAVAKEIAKNIAGLKGYAPVGQFAETILEKGWHHKIAKTRYTDDSKVTDHYAIIPTGQLGALGSLTQIQRKVFELIARRFLSIFYPPAEYRIVKLVFQVERESFFTSARVLEKPGYLEVATPPGKEMGTGVGEEEDTGKNKKGKKEPQAPGGGEQEDLKIDPKVLLALSAQFREGDEIAVAGYAIRHGKTTPPKRYTSGSMVLAMENAGQLIEDEELREQIKGSGIGTSATRAEIIEKLVRIRYLNLNKKTQVLTPENFGEMVFEVVSMTVPALLNPKMTASWEKGLDGITRGTVDFGEYRGKLEAFIRQETEKMIGQDLREPLYERIRSFAVQDAGSSFQKRIGVRCPACGEGEIITTPFGFGCNRYKKDKTGCNFTIGSVAGLSLTEEQVKCLIEKKQTDIIRGFKNKSGKKFDARLVFTKDEKGKLSVQFSFEGVGPRTIEGIACPVCGGKIRTTPFGYGCTNYKGNEPGSCRFAIGKVAGKKLTERQVKKLLTGGRTDVIRGFKSKAGKSFDAALVYKDGDIRFEFPQE